MFQDFKEDKMSLIKKQKLIETKSTFGQLVIGPPGSGKTTYCAKMAKFLNDQLHRPTKIINLDPANDNMTYNAAIDIMELVSVEDVMDNLQLGPNGALIYCFEYIEKNIDWLITKLTELTTDNVYLIFDLPGQVELYTHHNTVKNIFELLTTHHGFQLCTVHLVDSHYCSEPTKFISTLLLSLNTMLQIGLPHVNVLSKADQLTSHSKELDFNIDYYTDVLDLEYLLDLLDKDNFSSKFQKLNSALISLIQDYALVSFILLDNSKEKDLITVKNSVDKANGFVYGAGEARSIQALLSCAVGARTQTELFDADN